MTQTPFSVEEASSVLRGLRGLDLRIGERVQCASLRARWSTVGFQRHRSSDPGHPQGETRLVGRHNGRLTTVGKCGAGS